MDISSLVNTANYGTLIQQQNSEVGVNEVANVEAAGGHDIKSQDKALVEQNEIVDSFHANARSLQAAGERIGTLIDIKV